MKRLLLIMLCVTMNCLLVSAQGDVSSQIKGDFDIQTVWENTKGIVPEGWHASNVDRVMKFPIVFGDTDRTTANSKSVKMVNDYCGALGLGANAPAFISLGEFWSYAWCKFAFVGGKILASDGGTHGGITFINQPDSIVGYIKRAHGIDTGQKKGEQNLEEKAQILAYFWTGSTKSQVKSGLSLDEKTDVEPQEMIDRDKDVLGMITEGVTKSENFSLVATVDEFIEGDYQDWTYVSFPVNYLSDVLPGKVNVIISSAEYFNSNTIGKGNTLWADDFKFVYNSKLKSLAIGDTPLEGFDKDKYIYTIQGELPEVDDIVAVSDGKGAQVDIQKSNNVIKIIVTGNDGAENQHVYSLVKEGAAFNITAIQLNGVALEGFKPNTYEYKNLKMVDNTYPTVTVSADPDLTTVDVRLNEAKYTITIAVTDKFNNKGCTYVLKFNNPQLKGDFDVWENCYPDGQNLVGQQPLGWTASNVFQIMVGKEFVYFDKGHTGSSAKIMNDFVGLGEIGANAPAFVTLGNMWVFADMYGMMTGDDKSDGGVNGGVDFAYRPDSLTLYYKRKLGTEKPDETAKILVYLWKGTFKSKVISGHRGSDDLVYTEIDDQERAILGKDKDITPADTKGDGVLIGSAEYTISSATDDWTRLSIPIKYVEGENGKLVPEKMNVIFSGCNYWVRADIGKDNTLWVDDAVLVYNAKLSSLKLDGVDMVGFNSDKFEYTLPFSYRDKEIDAKAWGGEIASVNIAVTKNTADEVVKTITVTCDNTADVQKTYTYVLTFKGESAGEITAPDDMEKTYGDEFEMVFTTTNPDVPMTYTISNEEVLRYDSKANKFYAIGAGSATVTARQEKEGALSAVSRAVAVNVAKAKVTMTLNAWCQRGKEISFTTTSEIDIANNGKDFGIDFEYEGLKNGDGEGTLKEIIDKITDGKGLWVSKGDYEENEVVGEFRDISFSFPLSMDPLTSLSTKNYEITLENLKAEIRKTFLTVYPYYSMGAANHSLFRNDTQETFPVGAKIDWRVSYGGFAYDEEEAVMNTLGNDTVTVECSKAPEIAEEGEVIAVTVKFPQTVLENYEFRTYTGLSVKALKGYTIEDNEISDKTYGDKPFDVPFVIKDAEGKKVDYSISTSDYRLLSAANDTTVTIKGAGDNVYVTVRVSANDEYTDFAQNVYFSIAKAPFTVKAKNVELPLGEEAPKTFAFELTGFVNEDDSAKVFTTAPSAVLEAEIPSDAKVGDTFPIIVTPGQSANYELTAENGTLTLIVGTGIQNKALPDVCAYSKNGAIYVANKEALDPVRVYTVQGVKVYEGTDDVITTNIERNTMYVVRVGSYVAKVSVK